MAEPGKYGKIIKIHEVLSYSKGHEMLYLRIFSAKFSKVFMHPFVIALAA